MSRFFGLNMDFAGALTAAICALHCTTFPILLSLGLVSTSTHNHTFDFIFMALGVLIAGYVLVKDMLYKHKSFVPVVVAAIGFIVLFTGIESHGEYYFLNILGGVLIVVSHFLNYRLTHRLTH